MRGLGRVRQRFANLSRSLALQGGVRAVLGGGGLVLGLRQVINTLDDLSKLKAVGDAFGISAEAASGLFGMFAQNGGKLKEDIEGMVQFSQRLRDALTGVGGATGEAGKLFQDMSISAKDLEGVPLDEAFFRIHEEIRKLPQGLQASKLALIGGTDSMKLWLPLLSKSTDELRAQARALASSEADMQAAKETTLAYRSATIVLTQAWRQVAVAIAPIIQRFSTAITDAAGPIILFIKNNKAVIATIVLLIAKTATIGVALLAVSAIFAGLSLTIGTFMSVMGLLLSPAGLVGIGIAALALTGQFGDLNVAWAQVGKVFESVAERMKAAWQGVVAAFKAGDLKGAFKIIGAALELGFVQLTNIIKIEVDKLIHQFGASLSKEAINRQLRHVWDQIAIQLDPAVLGPNRRGIDQRLAELDKQFLADMAAIRQKAGTAALDPSGLGLTQRFLDEILIPQADARNKLNQAIAEAKQTTGQKVEQQQLREAFRNLFRGRGGIPDDATAGAPRVSMTSAGAFGATVGGRQFQRGTEVIQKKQLEVQQDIAETNRRIAEAVKDAGPFVWGT